LRRIKVVLALALALAMMVTISVAPALANNNDDKNNNDRQLDRQDIHLDKQLLNQNDGFRFNNDDSDFCGVCGFDNSFAFSPFFFNDDNCLEWSWVFEEWEWEC
jgi:hypothetical protein